MNHSAPNNTRQATQVHRTREKKKKTSGTREAFRCIPPGLIFKGLSGLKGIVSFQRTLLTSVMCMWMLRWFASSRTFHPCHDTEGRAFSFLFSDVGSCCCCYCRWLERESWGTRVQLVRCTFDWVRGEGGYITSPHFVGQWGGIISSGHSDRWGWQLHTSKQTSQTNCARNSLNDGRESPDREVRQKMGKYSTVGIFVFKTNSYFMQWLKYNRHRRTQTETILKLSVSIEGYSMVWQGL